MPRTAITGDIPTSHLPFSPAVAAGPFVFVSGQASVSDTGQILLGTFAEEFARSFDHVRRILGAAGCTMDDVVRVTSYVAKEEYLAEYNRLYRELFQEPLPARTTLVGCLGTDSIKFEVDVIAYRETSAG
ncbi:MAG: RidA family protein [Planctomycetaceae bacterium]|nr:RidA family protein [Planctomycetaceae bacterium]